MGQFQSQAPSNAMPISNVIHSELTSFNYLKNIGTSRFLKSVKCEKEGSGVKFVIKVYIKRSLDESLLEYQTNLLLEKDQLMGLPNLLPYDAVLETASHGFAIRQFIHSSLYDRISTRPFLATIEKQWITFQILSALVECHARFRYHGDIRSENIMVTSWNWAYIVDFACFKPVYLPDDDPTNYSYFFDASSRRSCYVAPERFVAASSSLPNFTLTPEMDIFSLGCTIAELFLEGTPLFTLSQLLRYRKGEFDPFKTLEKIENEGVRSMIAHMIALNPEDRFKAQEYLRVWRETAFPDLFYSFLYPYIANISDTNFAQSSGKNHVSLAANAKPLVTDCDARIDLIYNDFSKLVKSLGLVMNQEAEGMARKSKELFPVWLAIPEFEGQCTNITCQCAPGESDLSLILCSLLTSAIRNCLFPNSKLQAIEMLLVLGMQLGSEYMLDRIVPYLVVLLKDDCPSVRANSLIVLTQLLSQVTELSANDTNVFPDYILPGVKSFSTDPSVYVRATYAQCISQIAESALLFLELSELVKSEPVRDSEADSSRYYLTYDANLKDLQDMIQEDVVSLLTDPSSSVKRSLLSEMPRMCIFFGTQKANDFLISHIITYLNDFEWSLRAAFCEAIIGVGTFAGTMALEQFILPLLVMALSDEEEAVSEKVINSLTSLAELGLIQKQKLKELVGLIAPLLCHPNTWIRNAAIGFICSTSKLLAPVDVQCVIYQLVKPFMATEAFVITEEFLMEKLKPAVSRESYDRAIAYIMDKKRNVKGEINSDFMSSLRASGMSIDDKEKIDALKFYISKAGNAKLRSLAVKSQTSLEYIALREQNIIPHTVFLAPNDRSLDQLQRNAAELSITSLTSSKRESSSKRDSSAKRESSSKRPNSGAAHGSFLSPTRRFSKNTQEVTSPGSEKGSRDRISGLSFVSAKSRVTVGDANTVVDGKEKHIHSLLEKKSRKLAPPLLPELGAKGKKVSNTQPMVLVNPEAKWTPHGILVGHFPEHRGPVNDLQMAPDHMFFASTSDDGTVKIWDTNRLYTNVVNRSRLTYAGHDSPVKSVAFIDGRHSIASSSVKGQIHISKIEYIKQQSSTKYDSYTPITAISLKDDYASMISHHETENASLLVYATRKGHLTAIDLRSMKAAWSFEPPPHYGLLTSMICDRNHSWIMAGTHRGVLALWDIRFSLMVKSWQHPSKSAITKLDLYTLPLQGKGASSPKSVCMSVENFAREISVWDIESASCQQVWCVAADETTDPSLSMSNFYGENFQALPVPTSADLLKDSANRASLHSLPKRSGRHTFAISPQLRCMVSGGNDRNLRFHNLEEPEKSFILSGPSSGQPAYKTLPHRNTFFNIEQYDNAPFNSSRIPQRNLSDFSMSAPPDFSTSPTPDVHLDAITAVTISNRPCDMIISGSRDGTIKAFAPNQMVHELEHSDLKNKGMIHAQTDMKNEEEQERASKIIQEIHELVAKDSDMISFKQLGLNVPRDRKFIPKVLKMLESEGAVFYVVEHGGRIYQGVSQAFNLKRFERLKAENSKLLLEAGKTYVINYFGDPGSEIQCSCGYEWTEGGESGAGIKHNCSDPEMFFN